MVEPLTSTAPLPNPDLPPQVVADYTEAREIAQRSPRGAAALLRLAIEKLCAHLGGTGKDLDRCINDLVSQKGLDVDVRRMLDSVRVIGNQAVHPGTMDLRDDPTTVDMLFFLVNEIATETISKPKRLREFHAGLPEDVRERIDKGGKNA